MALHKLITKIASGEHEVQAWTKEVNALLDEGWEAFDPSIAADGFVFICIAYMWKDSITTDHAAND
jgi:hypothetical protein